MFSGSRHAFKYYAGPVKVFGKNMCVSIHAMHGDHTSSGAGGDDNMDCFADTFRRVRKTRRPAGHRSAATLAQWAFFCDDMICSSDVAVLKSEGPVGFFGPWLSRHGMTFHDALLIDDREDNCAAFRQQGGTALRWRMGADDITEAATALSRWLDAPASTGE
ncbi:hypothetical protein ITP53_24245 [Nonomuraea sp. K274]|uniref:Uncharacterized protein n=1 Tax=Nonomuraea cypriaca TaxID=1187855 RepID=A0A931ABH8_9ACTN|nr:hypothetical protein [Nonomuraea cypriaca]MBF8188788.1 hypothetical protein [Nonomuraea cypriaca]